MSDTTGNLLYTMREGDQIKFGQDITLIFEKRIGHGAFRARIQAPKEVKITIVKARKDEAVGSSAKSG
jgi:sRNA-binding carbon storage regulator CsrA